MYIIETISRMTENNWKILGIHPGDDPAEWFNAKIYKHLSLDAQVNDGETMYFSDDKGGWQQPEFFRARKVERLELVGEFDVGAISLATAAAMLAALAHDYGYSVREATRIIEQEARTYHVDYKRLPSGEIDFGRVVVSEPVVPE